MVLALNSSGCAWKSCGCEGRSRRLVALHIYHACKSMSRRPSGVYNKNSVQELLRLRALAYWAEANEATEAEKHAALRLRVRHRRIKVAAAFLCHTRFDDAITEKIVSVFPLSM